MRVAINNLGEFNSFLCSVALLLCLPILLLLGFLRGGLDFDWSWLHERDLYLVFLGHVLLQHFGNLKEIAIKSHVGMSCNSISP